MSARGDRIVEVVIGWAVAPQPPLPPIEETDAVAAFRQGLERGPRAQGLLLRGTLLSLELLPLTHGQTGALSTLSAERRSELLGRLMSGRMAPLGRILATMSHLAYYGDATVMRVVGYDPDANRARGAAMRAAEARW